MIDLQAPELIIRPDSVGFKIKELRTNLPSVEVFPDHLDKVINDQSDSFRLFNSAKELWEEVYNPEAIQTCVQILGLGRQTGENFELSRKYLKAVRKPGNMLMSAFLLLDEKHFAPEEHWRVVMNMGKVVDYSESPNFPKYKERLQMALSEYYPKKTSPIFRPDGMSGFDTHFSQTLNLMQNILSTSDKSNVRELHRLRKNGTRLLMNLFQLSCISRDNTEHKQMFFWLKMLDSQLGDSHGISETKRIQQMGDYTGVEMMIPELTRNNISKTIQFIAAQWGLNLEGTNEVKPDIYSEDYNAILLDS